MGMLDIFGLDVKLFIFQVVNFLIIFAILVKFLYNPLRNMLEERKRRIAQSMEDAEAARLALANADASKKDILAQAKKDADAISAAAKVQLAAEKEKSEMQNKQRGQQIIDEARQQAASELESVKKQVGQMSVSLSSQIVNKVFADFFTDDDKQKILSRAIDKISKVEYEKGSN
jgi:F-type H+-transporting ATPase subunit b